MSQCPLHPATTLISYLGDSLLLECPVGKEKYIQEIWGVKPIPDFTVSIPVIVGYEKLVAFRKNSTTGNLEYTVGDSYDFETISSSGGGDLTYLELNADGLSAGNLNLTDANWNESKVQVDYIKVIVTAGEITNFDIAIFEKDTFQNADKRYEAQGLNSTDNWEDDLEWIYTDDDATNEMHLQITENAGVSGTYSVQLRGIKLI